MSAIAVRSKAPELCGGTQPRLPSGGLTVSVYTTGCPSLPPAHSIYLSLRRVGPSSAQDFCSRATGRDVLPRCAVNRHLGTARFHRGRALRADRQVPSVTPFGLLPSPLQHIYIFGSCCSPSQRDCQCPALQEQEHDARSDPGSHIAKDTDKAIAQATSLFLPHPHPILLWHRKLI